MALFSETSLGQTASQIVSHAGQGNLSLSSYGFSVEYFRNNMNPDEIKNFNDAWKQVSSMSIDAGQAFLAGNVTSAFATAMKTPIASYTTQTVLNSYQIYDKASYLYTYGGEIMRTAIKTITNTIVTNVVKQATTVTGRYAIQYYEMGKKIPARIKDASLAYFNAYKPELDLSKFFKTSEQKSEEEKTKNQESSFSKKLGDIAEKSTKIMDKINTISGQINEAMGDVMQCGQAGTGWIEQNVNRHIKNISSQYDKQMGEWYKDATEDIDKWVKKQGEKYGKRMIDEYANALDIAQQKLEELKERKLTKSKMLAETNIQKAKLQLMALTGINIPLL